MLDEKRSNLNFSSVADPRCFDVYPRSRIRIFFPLGSRIHNKECKTFNPKKCFLSSRKYDPDCLYRIRILIFYPSRIPGSKRHRMPDPEYWILVHIEDAGCVKELKRVLHSNLLGNVGIICQICKIKAFETNGFGGVYL